MEKRHLAILFFLLIVGGGLVTLPWSIAENQDDPKGPPHNPIGPWKLRLVLLLLTRGRATTLEGELFLVEGRILVLERDEEGTYIVLPTRWLVGGKVLTINDLFDGDPFEMGDVLIIHVLTLSYEAENHLVEFHFAYLIEGEEGEAKALTPFNIRAI